MRSLIAFLFLTVLIVGCQSETKSHKYWLKSGTTLEQALKDCKKCKVSAHGDAQAGYYERHRERMESNHSSPFSEEFDRVDRDADDLRSFRSCMRQLGYDLVVEHRLEKDIRKTHRFGGNDIQYIAGI